MSKSFIEALFDRLTDEEKLEILKLLAAESDIDRGHTLTPTQQITDGDWFIHAIIAGRGFGKTYAASHWIKRKALDNPGARIAVVGPTMAYVRETYVHGSSGILAIHKYGDERPGFSPQRDELRWANGSTVTFFSADKPHNLYGPHFHYGVASELASWQDTYYPSGVDAYNNLLAAVRMGDKPQIVVETSPKKGHKLLKQIVKQSKDKDSRVEVVRGSTHNNPSLPNSYIENLRRQYGNTEAYDEEVHGILFDDNGDVL